MKDLMIDIETLGTEPNTPVISIGAVFFDIETKKLGPEFYVILDINNQLDRGRKPTGNTIKWWMSQSETAKKIFFDTVETSTNNAMSLIEFVRFIVKHNPNTNVWGNGCNFDITIMENLLKDYGIETPWTFRNIMDLRTFRRFKANNKAIKALGTHHMALDDAKSQAQFVLDNL